MNELYPFIGLDIHTSVTPSVTPSVTHSLPPPQHHLHHLAMESNGGETRRDCVLRSLKKSPVATMERPDSRFYSGRNPVPRVQESFWELVPDIVSSSDSEQEDLDQRTKKRLAKTKEVLDPITGKMWVYIAPHHPCLQTLTWIPASRYVMRNMPRRENPSRNRQLYTHRNHGACSWKRYASTQRAH